jgi:hypothetical protein
VERSSLTSARNRPLPLLKAVGLDVRCMATTAFFNTSVFGPEDDDGAFDEDGGEGVTWDQDIPLRSTMHASRITQSENEKVSSVKACAPSFQSTEEEAGLCGAGPSACLIAAPSPVPLHGSPPTHATAQLPQRESI